MKKNYRLNSNCLNCGSEVTGKFCSNCGQENVETKEHVGHMLTHAIGDYFHFDSKFIKTMRPLLLQPGFLTNEYNAGKRTTYLPAIRMYIFISIIFFLSISVVKSPALSIGSADRVNKTEISKNNLSVANSVSGLKQADSAQLMTVSQKKVGKIRGENRLKLTSKDQTVEEYVAEQEGLPASKRDGSLNYYLKHKALELEARENIQDVFIETLVHNLPKMMFLLLPLFALNLMLIFRKSRMFYGEHFIYALHLHSFLYLFLLIPIFIGKAINVVPDFIYWTIFFGITLYIYKSLRTVYQNSRTKTIVKMVIMGTSYSVLLGICLFLLVVSTFFML
jgi:hypothetical protein